MFLVGLEGEDSNECKEFVKNIRDPKPAFPNKLIVHTNDINKLPKYFPEHFEIIELEAEKQDTSTSIPKDTPQGKKRNKLFYSYNEKDKLTLFVKKDESITLTKTEAKLFLFLKEDRRTLEEIIEHVWEVYKQKDIDKKKEKGNIKELRNRINNKCRVKEIGVENLISKLKEGCYGLTVDVAER